jgi:hypothetical protein
VSGFDARASMTDRTRLGPVLESFGFGELLNLSTIAEQELHLLHYRDKDQVEVDFIVESCAGDLIGIEPKKRGNGSGVKLSRTGAAAVDRRRSVSPRG